MKTAEQMLQLVKGLMGEPWLPTARCVRQYVGHNQRSGGAWSWAVEGHGMPYGVGSQWSMTRLLREHSDKGQGITVKYQPAASDFHIYPSRLLCE